MDTLYDFLLFPKRAENLGQHAAYDVDLAHWKALSGAFRTVFRTVHDRGSSSVLLVHGVQGTGKTLFSIRLKEDFEKTRSGST